MIMGDFVWYRGVEHVYLRRWGWFVELIRFGDKSKRTFWTLERWTRPFSEDDYYRLLNQ